MADDTDLVLVHREAGSEVRGVRVASYAADLVALYTHRVRTAAMTRRTSVDVLPGESSVELRRGRVKEKVRPCRVGRGRIRRSVRSDSMAQMAVTTVGCCVTPVACHGVLLRIYGVYGKPVTPVNKRLLRCFRITDRREYLGIGVVTVVAERQLMALLARLRIHPCKLAVVFLEAGIVREF